LLTGMTGVAAGTYCSISFRSGGGIYAWGDPLVNGDGHSRETPAQVKGVDGRATLGGVIAAACGSNHAWRWPPSHADAGSPSPPRPFPHDSVRSSPVPLTAARTIR
jgi:hypothetical protein